MSAERWLMMRDKLRHIRSVDCKIEMTADAHLSGSFMVQFTYDVQMYGLYEAVLMVPEDVQDGLMADMCGVFDKHPVIVPLPEPREYTSMSREGKILPPAEPRSMRPESIWQLQEMFIRQLTVTKETRQIFESVLPPHVSQTYIDKAVQQDLYSAVRDAPYQYREQLCARLIRHYDIPKPPEPKVKVKHIVEGKPKKRPDRLLVIDKAGNAWTWDLGWYRVNEAGDEMDRNKPRLGHRTFRRAIIPADPDDFRRTAFHYTRPWGQWRTTQSGPVAHELFGNGVLRITDGVHAVVDFNDGIRRETVLANLTQISVKLPRQSHDTTTKPRTPREKKQKELSLEDLLKML
jgi:hypothetical protein